MKISLAFLLLAPLPLLAALEEKSPPVRSTDEPSLVWDLAPDVTKGYRSFRTTNDAIKPKEGAKLPDTTGLATLHESGSSEFDVAGMKKMMTKFSGPVTVFDLRQEDHGFINDEPVSWFTINNWGNVGKTNADITADERMKLQALKPGSSVELTDDSVKKGGDAAKAPHRTETVTAAETEKKIVTGLHADYVRITVSDHSRPTDAEVDRFVEAVRKMPDDGWAHFHCRAGKGRTTTFMALYDMLRNAPQVSLQSIVDRQSLLAGDYDLLGKEAEPGARVGVAADRANFVRAFYTYAQANPGGKPQLWSDWIKSH
jgi:protein-tyrosine phosphatase